MDSWFGHLNGIETFFFLCAFAGGLFVALRMTLLFLGIEGDSGAELDVNIDEIDIHHADSDIGFKLLSLQSLSSFLLMFGLVGLALYRENKEGFLISLAGALLAGMTAVWAISKLFMLFQKLQSSGTIMPDDAIGAQGKVYLTIPENGTGRVLVYVQNRLREYDAKSINNTKIDTGQIIHVLKTQGPILIVTEPDVSNQEEQN